MQEQSLPLGIIWQGWMGWNHKDMRRCSFLLVFPLWERKKEKQWDPRVTLWKIGANYIKHSGMLRTSRAQTFSVCTFNTIFRCNSIWSCSDTCKVSGAAMPEGKSIKDFHKNARYILYVNSHTEATRSQLFSSFMPGWKRFQWEANGKTPLQQLNLTFPLTLVPVYSYAKQGLAHGSC